MIQQQILVNNIYNFKVINIIIYTAAAYEFRRI